MARTINVLEDARDVTSINLKGETELLGQIIVSDYDGEAKGYQFTPTASNKYVHGQKNRYRLGYGSVSSDFINPADVQGMLLDNGWEMKDQLAWKGGLQMTSVFIKPEAARKDDIMYDLSVWQTEENTRSQEIYPAVVLDTNLVFGKMAARFNAAYWRTICTNGLRARILGLPIIDIRHSLYEPDEILSMLDASGIFDESLIATGPLLGSKKSLSQVVRVIRRWKECVENGAVTPELEALNSYFATFGGNRLKSWALENYLNFLDVFIEEDSRDSVYGLDLLNAFTNAVNFRRHSQNNDRGIWFNLAVSDNVVETTSQMMALAGLFA